MAHKPVILVVDDTPSNITILKNILKQDYQVQVALGGAEALNLLEEGPLPDLIILDIVMPEMDGYEVCRKLKGDENYRDIPVIFVSSLQEEHDETLGFELGAVDYIVKPIAGSVALKRIRTHVQLKQYKDYLEEIVEKRTTQLRDTIRSYERFVPKEFLGFLEKNNIIHVELGDHVESEIAVQFSDIRSFSSLSEMMTSDENFVFINNYLGKISPIIREHGGIIDKYIGDAVMALYPRSSRNSIESAVALHKLVMETEFPVGTNNMYIKVGTGIHTGPVMLGIIGETERLEGTVISDSVNLASRLQELTKDYGCSLIVSEECLEDAGRERFTTRFLDTIQVRGRMYPVSIYEVLDAEDEQVREKKIVTSDQYLEGWQLFCDGRVEEAYGIFNGLLDENPQDKAARLHLLRCKEYMIESGGM